MTEEELQAIRDLTESIRDLTYSVASLADESGFSFEPDFPLEDSEIN
jgi:hypothetical protein